MLLVWIILLTISTNIWLTFEKVFLFFFEKVYFAVVEDKLTILPPESNMKTSNIFTNQNKIHVNKFRKKEKYIQNIYYVANYMCYVNTLLVCHCFFMVFVSNTNDICIWKSEESYSIELSSWCRVTFVVVIKQEASREKVKTFELMQLGNIYHNI